MILFTKLFTKPHQQCIFIKYLFKTREKHGFLHKYLYKTVCSAERGICAFSSAPHSTIINCRLFHKQKKEKPPIVGKAFCSRKTALLSQSCSLRSVTLTPTYRRSFISPYKALLTPYLTIARPTNPCLYSLYNKQGIGFHLSLVSGAERGI